MIEDSTPSISVIIPTYNAARFIGDAVNSVLEQTVKPMEVIVVDDGSTDNTESIVKEMDGNIRYFYQENSGSSIARNTGLEYASGELLSFLDADDIWVKDKLEIQLKLLRNNPEYDVVIGLLYRIPVEKTEEVVSKKIEGGEYATSLGSTIMKKEVFEEIGTFDEELTMAQDVDFFLRILEADINVLGHEDVVQFYRRHDKNMTSNEKKANMYLLKAFRKSLNRRRSAGKELEGFLPGSNKNGSIIDFWNQE